MEKKKKGYSATGEPEGLLGVFSTAKLTSREPPKACPGFGQQKRRFLWNYALDLLRSEHSIQVHNLYNSFPLS